jgi:hypothetical protein
MLHDWDTLIRDTKSQQDALLVIVLSYSYPVSEIVTAS